MGAKTRKGDMKYYSQYRIHDLFELQESLSGLSKSNRWVKLADRLPWAQIEKEYNKRLRNNHCGAGNKLLKTEDIHPPKTGISVHFSGSLV